MPMELSWPKYGTVSFRKSGRGQKSASKMAMASAVVWANACRRLPAFFSKGRSRRTMSAPAGKCGMPLRLPLSVCSLCSSFRALAVARWDRPIE